MSSSIPVQANGNEYDNVESEVSERMRLIPVKAPSHEADGNKKTKARSDQKGTTVALSVAMLVQSYLLVSVFPYSGFLAMFLIPGLNEETAGRYAGLVASSFMFGRTFSSFQWGKAADEYGRVFVIRASLLLSAAFSICFGLAPSFRSALVWRFILGLSNGLMGPIKTIVSEVTHGDQKKETRTMGIVIGMWGYGFLINPAIGGYLSDPVKQYPNTLFVEWFEPILSRYPFLLPNVVGCLLCLVAFFMVGRFVQETLPEEKLRPFSLWASIKSKCSLCFPRQQPAFIRRVSSWGLFKHMHPTEGEMSDEFISADERKDALPKWISPSPSTSSLVYMSRLPSPQKPSRDDEQLLTETTSAREDEEPATIRSLWNRIPTRRHLLVYWMYSFLVISVDETFPLYCISKESGLAVQEKNIGDILSSTGIFYVTLQYFLLTTLVNRLGLYPAMRIGAIMSIPVCCLMPITLITIKGAPEGQVNWPTLAHISITYAVIRAFSTVTFSTLTMSTNKTVPSHHRATMNGLSMLGGSLAKAAGPTFAGFLFSTSVTNIVPPYGSVVAYFVISLLGVGLFIQTLLLTPSAGMSK
ncbi:unnamed protein product [Cylindrotheca closterium]|uniref:Major facilitator superfamily (MFS) profile domain-containing protein n=1 Tax=Cylindrotheca closterium TaxID=2856 RepID=A0AAD2FQM5_9STRA|nr:unnamed protein product [Cylindrotheca closterium]